MKIAFKYITVFTCLSILTYSCSRKKDRFVNRHWHALNTKYNVLYNGGLALEEGINELDASYKDNYWGTLPVERLAIEETLDFEDQKLNPNFERSEEKAIKAVQTHGMKIKGKEKNNQIDEAYIMLGINRYYSGRFIPAIEAFNYILFKHPASNNINTAKLWRAKSNLRLENESVALKDLKELLQNEGLSETNKIQAYASLAQLYIDTGSLKNAISSIENAATITKDKMFEGRLRFIQGQLYNIEGKKDSADIAFQKVINLKRKVPRSYRINAFLEQVKNFNYSSKRLDSLEDFLDKIASNRENRPYLDRIYHTTAKHYLKTNKDSIAISYFNKSLQTKSQDLYLNAVNYHTIADYYYENSNYTSAGVYYDSTLANYQKRTKPYRAVKKRLDNLKDVILYESIVKVNDSILKLVSLPENELISYFDNYIKTIKFKSEKAKNKPTKSSRMTINSAGGKENSKAGSFYFYQNATVAYGKEEFKTFWGERPLEDNWRWFSKKVIGDSNDKPYNLSKETKFTENITSSMLINRLPKDSITIDSISRKRNFANFKLGLIYKNKFKDYNRSRLKLESLLSQNPEQRLILPANYNLYKVYILLEETTLAETLKHNIINNYPESRYAQILMNPLAVLENNNQSPQSRYKILYDAFELEDYQKVIKECELDILRFEGDDIVPKLELLKTSAKGRLYGFETYKEGLSYIALNYPNNSEGKKAQKLIDNDLKSMENETFEEDSLGVNFKTIFQFPSSDVEVINEFKSKLNIAIEKEDIFQLSLSEDIYDINTTFVVVHGLKSINGAMGFTEILNIEIPEIVDKSYFAISSSNYKTLQIHKNLGAYLELIKN
ncbi:MAG: hypothetical protein CMC86_02840 [Flavobacteriaceae bacterium]|nr:hypothetical protein [Flavobacteriaceae bacterium]